MIIECIDNQEADLLADELLRKELVTCTQGSGKVVLICDCGCGELFRNHCIEDFQGYPDDSGWDRITTDELRERIAAEDTGESSSSERPGAMYSLSEMQEDEVLREPQDGDVRVSQGDMWDVRTVTPEWATGLWGTWLPEERIPLAGDTVGPRTGRHEQTRRLQQEYQRVLDEASRIRDEAAERYAASGLWDFVDRSGDYE